MTEHRQTLYWGPTTQKWAVGQMRTDDQGTVTERSLNGWLNRRMACGPEFDKPGAVLRSREEYKLAVVDGCLDDRGTRIPLAEEDDDTGM